MNPLTYDVRMVLVRWMLRNAPAIGAIRNLIDPRAPHYSKEA